MNTDCYQPIFDYRMKPDEAETYRIAVAYQVEFYKVFRGTPQYYRAFKMNTIPKRGDPRKSRLFQHCWKLRRETRGLLEPQQYRQYLHANFSILKLHNAFVTPNAVCGDKAWIRWKVYERWFKNKQTDLALAPPPSSASDPKVIMEIDKTKKFLFEKCEGEPSKDKIQRFIKDGFFKLWVSTGKVSPFYVVLSPLIKDYVDDLAKVCAFDPSLIREKATDGVRKYFADEFKHEEGL